MFSGQILDDILPDTDTRNYQVCYDSQTDTRGLQRIRQYLRKTQLQL